MPYLSILIPTFNRATELKAAIESTLNQSFTDFELIIVDNGPSTDNTAVMVTSLAETDKRIKYIQTESKGIVHAKKTAVNSASGEILLTLDDDIEFIEPDSIQKMIDVFKNDPAVGIVGAIEIRQPGQVVDKGPEILPADTGRISVTGNFNTAFGLIQGHGVTEVDHVRGAFMGIRRQAYDDVNGYDEIYYANGRAFRYETDLCMRIKRLAYKIVVNPDIKIWHKAAPHKRGFQRGRGLEFLYYSNRNNTFFMRRFFYKKFVIFHILRDILVGAPGTPGIGHCLKKIFTEENPYWAFLWIVTVVGKISGNIRYCKYGNKKNTDNM